MRWDDYRQILVHYYTGIHIRDAAGNFFTPDDRWNPPTHTIHATMTTVAVANGSLQLQNTSRWGWYEDMVLGWQ